MSNNNLINDSIKEIEDKLNILNKETKNWIIQKMLFHISEAYERGKREGKSFKGIDHL